MRSQTAASMSRFVVSLLLLLCCCCFVGAVIVGVVVVVALLLFLLIHRICHRLSSRVSRRSRFVCVFLSVSVDFQGVMNLGNNNRSVGVTDMNEHSSRSHAIFMVTVECSETREGENHIRYVSLLLASVIVLELES